MHHAHEFLFIFQKLKSNKKKLKKKIKRIKKTVTL